MMYALKLSDSGRILSATDAKYATPNLILVHSLPTGNIADYLYVNGTYVYEPLPEPELTQTQKRENAYNTERVINWEGNTLTVTEASNKWQYYAAEGNTAKTDELTTLIAEAKASIREQYPDK